MSTTKTTLPKVGISGISSYFPHRRVNLEDWSSWRGANWDKIQAVVGTSFRVADPREDIYTMAAEALFRLLRDNDISPSTIGLLILATESSLDNAVGASTLRGLTDRRLKSEGLPAIDRNCETYELKQACLAGVYGIKQALRWAMLMPAHRHAVVVSVDIAEYELGSTGEPTQGAGAIATLITQRPALLELDPRESGSSSVDRETDFRKPHQRPRDKRNPEARPSDFPVFDGPYSTSCYLDSVCAAFENLTQLESLDTKRAEGPIGFDRLFFHRPYRQLPERAACTLLASTIQQSKGGGPESPLSTLVHQADVETDVEVVELGKRIHKSQVYRDVLEPRLELGKALTSQFGNLYTASLPAWIAAAFTEALENSDKLNHESWLLIGYGSGDAAEAMVGKVVNGWEDAARKIGIVDALSESLVLDESEYLALHRDGAVDEAAPPQAYRYIALDPEQPTSVIPKYKVG